MAGVLGNLQSNSNAITIGGFTILLPSLDDLIVMNTILGSAQFGTLRQQGSSNAGFQVAGGKQLRIFGVRIDSGTVVAGEGYRLGYGDNDVGLTSGGEPTNSQFLINATNTNSSTIASGHTNGVDEYSLNFIVPATKFPFAYQANNISATIQVFGLLETL